MKWMMLIGMVAMLNLAGCDTSKEELESTKSALANTTKERNDLKTQVTTLQQQLDATKAELVKAQTAATAAAAVAKPAADAKTTAAKTTAAPAPAKGKHKS